MPGSLDRPFQIKKIKTFSYSQAINEFYWSMFFLSLFQMFLFVYLLLSFIFPPDNEQGNQRYRDIEIGKWTEIGLLGINLYKECDTNLKQGLIWLRDNSYNPALQRLINKSRLIDFFGLTDKPAINQWFRHLRANGVNIGVILAFMSVLALRFSKGEANGFIRWLNSNEVNFIISRAAVAVASTITFTCLGYWLSVKEHSTSKNVSDEMSLLKPKGVNQAEFNKYSRIRWAGNLFYTATYMFVFSGVVLELLEDFGLAMSDETKLNIAEGLGVFGFMIAVFPDRSLFNKYSLTTQRFGRFLDKFVKLGLLRNIPFFFDQLLNVISFLTGQLKNLTLNTATAGTLAYLSFYPIFHMLEALYRLTATINEDPCYLDPRLATWNVALEEARTKFSLLKTFNGNPYALIPMMPLAVIASVEKFVDVEYAAPYKQQLLRLPTKFIQQLFNVGLALPLIGLNKSALLVKSTVGLSLASVLTALQLLAERYPTLQKIMSTGEAGLLAANVYNAARQFHQYEGVLWPEYPQYIVGGAIFAGFTALQLREIHLQRKRDQYQVINDAQADNTVITPAEKLNYIADSARAGATFIVSAAALNEWIQGETQEEPLMDTGVNIMLLLLMLNAALMMYIFYYNFTYKVADDDGQAPKAPGWFEKGVVKGLIKIGLFKNKPLYEEPLNARVAEEYQPSPIFERKKQGLNSTSGTMPSPGPEREMDSGTMPLTELKEERDSSKLTADEQAQMEASGFVRTLAV